MSNREHALDDLLDEVRRFKADNRLSVREFARLCGLTESTLRDIDNPEWAPSVTTLRAVLRAIDGPMARFLTAVQQIDRLSLGVLPFDGPDGRCLERVLRPEATDALGKDELAAALRELGPGTGTAERAVEIAKRLVPGAVVHLVDVSAADPTGYVILQWDNRTDYRGGEDFSGTALLDVEDAAYRDELRVAYSETKASGRPRVSFIHRRGIGGVRSFYRALIPFPGPGNGTQIVAVVLPQEPKAARYLVPHRFRG